MMTVCNNEFSFRGSIIISSILKLDLCGCGQFVDMASFNSLRYEDRSDRVLNFNPWKKKITMVMKMNGL